MNRPEDIQPHPQTVRAWRRIFELAARIDRLRAERAAAKQPEEPEQEVDKNE